MGSGCLALAKPAGNASVPGTPSQTRMKATMVVERARRTGNLLYAQSGGVTAVINATAAGVIETARKHKSRILKVYAGADGIAGILAEDLIDTSGESDTAIRALRHTPGGAFGSCRVKLKDPVTDAARYRRFLEVCAAHDIRWFLYNGGNDSADTAAKLAAYATEQGADLCCIGVPKTVDNDLMHTDFCPGFGSVAKYAAVSTLEASLDVASMASTSTKVFVLEVMGRHAGWIAAAAGLAGKKPEEPPQLILFPEVAFDEARFLARVREVVAQVGWCTVVVSEGVRDAAGKFLADQGLVDDFGHRQLGGAGPVIAAMVSRELGLKVHYAIADYLQRSARHVASAVDAEVAYKVGEAAVKYALEGMNAVMPVVRRRSGRPYRYDIQPHPLTEIAGVERKLPEGYIREDGYGITPAARRYLEPLIVGEAPLPWDRVTGLPDYVRLKNRRVAKKLDRGDA